MAAVVLVLGALTALLPAAGTSGRATADAATSSAGLFVPVSGRLLDTRNGTGGYATPMPANTVRTVPAAGVAGIPASGVSAVALTLTVVGAATVGAISVAPGDVASPTGTALVFNPGDSVSNADLVALHTDGKLHVVSNAVANLIIDVQGYFTAGTNTAPGGFVAVDQTRIADTRSGNNVPLGRVATGSSIDVAATGLTGVPEDASAVYVNIAVLGQTSNGYLRVYGDGPVPTTGALDFDDATQSVSVAVPLNDNGWFTILVGAGGPVDLIVDIQGYFTPAVSGGGFTPAAVHLLDTRAAPVRTLAGNSVMTLSVAGVAGIPTVADGLAAVALNLRTVQPTTTPNAGGFLRVWPGDEPEPVVSNLNYTTATTYRTDLAIVAPAAAGTISIRNGGPNPIDLVIDVEGWFNLAAPELTSTYFLATQAVPSVDSEPAPDFHWASGDTHLTGFSYSQDGGPPVTVDASQTSLSWYPTAVGSHTLAVHGVLASGLTTPAASFTFAVASPVAPAVPSFLATDLGRVDGTLISGVVDGVGSAELTANFYVTDANGNSLGSGTDPYGSAQISDGQRASLVIPADALTTGATYHWNMNACGGGTCSARTADQTFVAGQPVASSTVATSSLTVAGASISGSSAPIGATACANAPCQPTVDGSLRVGDQGDGQQWRSYLTFNLSAIPAGAKVTSAVLTLGAATTTGASSPSTLGFTPLANAPPTGATGNVLAGLAEADGAFTANTTAPSADMASLVQGWLDGDHPNAGIAIAATTETAGVGVSFPSPSAPNGQPALAVTYQPPAAPDAPTGLTTRAGDGGLLASWVPPAQEGTSKGVDHYLISATAGSSVVQATTAAGFAVLSGLTNGQSYSVSVQAVNAVGAGPAVTATATPQAVPGGQTLLTCGSVYEQARDQLQTGSADSAAAALSGTGCTAQLAARLNQETPNLLSLRQIGVTEGHPAPPDGSPQLTGGLVLASADGGSDVWAHLTQSTDQVSTNPAPNLTTDVLLHYDATSTLVGSYTADAAWQPLIPGADPNGVLTSDQAASANDTNNLPAAVTDTAQGIPAVPDAIAWPQYRHSINRLTTSTWALSHYQDPHYNGSDNCTDFVSRALHFGGGMAYNYHHQPATSIFWVPFGLTPVPFGHAIHDDNAWFNGTSGNAIKRRWDGRNWTTSYNTAQNLMNFLSRNPGKFLGYFGDAQPGDIVFYAWTPPGGKYRTINHVGIVSWASAPDWDPEFWTVAQSNDYAYRSIWDALTDIRQHEKPGTSPAIYIYRPYGSSR